MGSMSAANPRTGLETLTEEECWTLLNQNEIGRLAVTVGGRPDIFPVNYVIDGRNIVLRTAAGLKLAAAVFAPSVAFEIDGVAAGQHGSWSVVVHGEAVEIEQTDELLRVADLGLVPWVAADKPRYLRIVPAEITGRRIP